MKFILHQEEFKTLIFKGDRTKVLGKYAVPLQTGKGIWEWVGCDTPELYPMSCSVEGLKSQLPDLDFRLVKLITVEVRIT